MQRFQVFKIQAAADKIQRLEYDFPLGEFSWKIVYVFA